MVRRGDVGRRPESPRRTRGEIPEVDVGEIEFCLASGVEVQAHAFVREGLPNMIAFSFVRQEAAAGDPLDFAIRRIDERFVVLVEPPRTGLVKFAGALLVQ